MYQDEMNSLKVVMFSINFINTFVDYFSNEKQPWYNFVGLIQLYNVPEIITKRYSTALLKIGRIHTANLCRIIVQGCLEGHGVDG